MKDIKIRIFEQHAREYDAWFWWHAHAYESEVMALRNLSEKEIQKIVAEYYR
jgi:hypothetical protein